MKLTKTIILVILSICLVHLSIPYMKLPTIEMILFLDIMIISVGILHLSINPKHGK